MIFAWLRGMHTHVDQQSGWRGYNKGEKWMRQLPLTFFFLPVFGKVEREVRGLLLAAQHHWWMRLDVDQVPRVLLKWFR